MKQLFTFFLISIVTQLQSQNFNDTYKDKLDHLLAQQVEGISPGIAVGIVKNGQIVYEKYLGYANLNHEIKIDEHSRFNIASNAKQYTALCILTLIDQGKLKLDDDIRKYLPNLYENIDHKITISQLLTHTSGVRDYCDLLALSGKTWWKQFIDNADAMEMLENQNDLNFKPGSEHLYSNSNYILLAEIVKKITGENFSKFSKALFENLDMPSTDFLTNYMAVIPNKASPYGYWNGWRETPIITEVHGDGALFTTLKDQLKWEQIIQRNEGTYLSQKLINESQNPLESSIEESYGYGLYFDSLGGLKRTYHNGATGGYRANFSRFPDQGLSLVVMTNNRNIPIDDLVWNIVDLVLGVESKKHVFPDYPKKIEKLKHVEVLTGIYRADNGDIIKIIEKKGSLYREKYRAEAIKLMPEKDGLYRYETIQGLKINFENIGQEDQKFTLYRSTQAPKSYHKISGVNMNGFDKTQLNGKFFNDETNTEIIITHKGNNDYSLIKNGRERNAELVSSDYLRMMNIYKIKIIRDENNNIIGLNVERDRIKNVIFDKI